MQKYEQSRKAPKQSNKAVRGQILFFLYKLKDGVHMPRRLMDDLEGEVANEEFHKCALWHDILSVYPDGEDALLLNICEHRAFGISHNVSRFICGERVWKVPEPFLDVVSECISAFVSHLDIAVCNPHGIYRIMVMQYHRLLCRLSIEDTHGDLLAPLGSFLLQIRFHILKPYGISYCFRRYDQNKKGEHQNKTEKISVLKL